VHVVNPSSVSGVVVIFDAFDDTNYDSWKS